MKKKTTVLVTGVGGGSVGRQILKALRYVGENYRIIATDMTRISMGLEEVETTYLVPSARDSAYIATIIEFIKSEKVKYIIPGSEPELWELSVNRAMIERAGAKLLANPHRVLEVCMDKEKTMAFLEEGGYPFPNTLTFNSTKGLSLYRQSITAMLPVVIKPTIASGGSLNVYLAQELDEVEFFIKYLQRQGLVPMIQEYIGSHEQEYTVGVLTHPVTGHVVSTVILKRFTTSGLSSRVRQINRHKNRISGDMLIISSGISQGEIVGEPTVNLFCERLAIGLGARGPINIQCRLHEGKVYVFEINPRFSGTTFIRVLAGINEPDLMMRLLNGEPDPDLHNQYGLMLRGLEEKFEPRES